MSEAWLKPGNVVHMLAQTLDALEQSIRARLSPPEMEDAWAKHTQSISERRALYNLFVDQSRSGQLACESGLEILGLTIREIAFLQNQIQNVASALNPGGITVRKRPVLIFSVLADLVELFHAKAAVKGVEIRINAREDLIAYADVGLLRRAMINIIDNAVKYSFSPGPDSDRFVKIEARRHTTGGDILISVASYGVGILPDEISSGTIFHVGVRGALASDRQREGTGLGLAETKAIIEGHGGILRVASDPQNDSASLTTVTLVLPSAMHANSKPLGAHGSSLGR